MSRRLRRLPSIFRDIVKAATWSQPHQYTDFMTPQLIGLDWGTTSCRAYLLGDGGRVLARVSDGPGILRVENGAFGPALDTLIGSWLTAHGRLPVVLSGMIGSRQGWVEVPYARCPASADDVVSGLARIDHGGLDIAVVPGLSTESHGMST